METTVAPMEETKKGKGSKKKMLMKVVMLVVVLGLAGSTWYFWRQNQKLKNPTEQAKAETDRLVREVGQIYALPTDETPTVATVTDAEKLKAQKFFENAANGDKVLIYTKAKLAILYRPSSRKIINVAPINLGNNSNSSQK